MCRSWSYSPSNVNTDDSEGSLVDSVWLDANPGGNTTIGSIYVECNTIVSVGCCVEFKVIQKERQL